MLQFLSVFKKSSRYKPLTGDYQLIGPFNNLSNEIIILILSQPVLTVHTLCNVMKISKRMFDLCLQVLVRYKLPLYTIEAYIDQEGHSRSMTDFSFQGIEPETMCILFEAKCPYTRRYYTNKEVPMIRRMMVRDLCCSQDSERIVLKKREREKGRTRIPLPSRIIVNTKIVIETKSRKIHKVQKEGIHNVQVSRLFSSPLLPINRLAWKFGYQIDQKTRKEYNLTPLSFDIQFNYFMQLIQNKKGKKM
ncbi:hypothetical protein BY458DRAFT_516299 [Sporodiniella umbellata]|nr:hypothetical protein BY458DRAFT_516299 [Sporodiniella umbellata]